MEDGGIDPYDISAVPCGSSAVAVHSAASSKLNNGSWRSRTPTVVNCTPAFETGCRPLGSSFHSGVSDGNRTRYYWFHKPAPLPLWLQTQWIWWGLNPQPLLCKRSVLPLELQTHVEWILVRIELSSFYLQGRCSAN